jgi:hypothetical protein
MRKFLAVVRLIVLGANDGESRCYGQIVRKIIIF